MTGVELQLGRC